MELRLQRVAPDGTATDVALAWSWTRLISDGFSFVNFSAMNLQKRTQNILKRSNLPVYIGNLQFSIPKICSKKQSQWKSSLKLTFAERCNTFVQPARHGKFPRASYRYRASQQARTRAPVDSLDMMSTN